MQSGFTLIHVDKSLITLSTCVTTYQVMLIFLLVYQNPFKMLIVIESLCEYLYYQHKKATVNFITLS